MHRSIDTTEFSTIRKVALGGAVACVLFAAATVLAGPSSNLFFGRWISSTAGAVAPMPEAREGACVGFSSAPVGGFDEDRIYVTHGFTSFGDTNDTRAYDIDTNTWLALSPAPTVRSEGVGVAKGGLVYCLGGRSFDVLATNEAYDPTTDSWTTLAPMSVARAGLAGAALGNKIYTFGGNAVGSGPCSGPALNVAEAYNVATDSWSPITPPPVPVTQAVAITKGSSIYLIGGCTAFNAVQPGPVQIYSPNTDSWSAGAPMPTGRASLALGVLGNTIYAIAGWDNFVGNLSVVEGYDVDQDLWVGPLSPKTTAVSETFGVSHGGRIFVPGSGAFGSSSSVNEVFFRM